MVRTSLIVAVILLIIGLVAPGLALLLLVALIIVGAAGLVRSSARSRRWGGRR
ncbi:hypothetical protein [Nocardia yunnanensis]|uniref:hypothetical protein n=1 Tax=Nocardia yunnanensis TaxID=2382165 RepID=UPI0013C45905|nr:hypothetical protein [Nocardia yunnanensis]